jgi:DNA-binding NarL/FixJ family response regulator
MPRKNGIELLPSIREHAPDVKVLVVSMHIDRSLVDLSLKAGAHGFVPKESSAIELRGAITAVARGERYVSPRVPKRPARSTDVLSSPVLDRLTKRQMQILKLIGEGRSGTEIAEALGVSSRTIEFHRAAIRRALGISTEWGLVRWAIVAGLANRRIEVKVISVPPAEAPSVSAVAGQDEGSAGLEA